MTKIMEWRGPDELRIMAAGMGMKPQQGGGSNMQDDQSDFDQQSGQTTMPGATVQDPSLAAAPYVRLLTKLGYEFQGHDEDQNGQKIGSSFTGQDGDTIMVKPDGSWNRFGPGAQKSQGKDVPALGQSLVKGTLAEGDDQNHHAALRQAGYNKIHKDSDGTTYYKHPQTGKSVHVTKDGKWGSSVGTGRGAGKLRDFLGNEQLESQDPAMMQTKLKQQQLKQGAGRPGAGGGAKPQTGTRGTGGTRPGGGGGMGRM
jgi:hypothetical protein